MHKVQLIAKDELKAKSVHSRIAIVEFRLNDGRRLVERCDHPPGTPQNRISDKDIYEKYRTCTENVLNKNAVKKLYELIMTLETLDNLNDLLVVADETL